ncbi:MAG TPA: TetR/AcrR family transcriptional regulator [Terracidiphilus sp.]|nr:TetR/AcrR family transcriptional regulator [Terracidiphilus sp.]
MTPSREQQREHTRAAILKAAIKELSIHGFDGASTSQIMKSAGINKALLYYYFKDKAGLYSAALEEATRRRMEAMMGALDAKCSAGERLLRTVLLHFDRFLREPESQRLVIFESIRSWSRRDKSAVVVSKEYSEWLERTQATIREGIKSGELRDVNPFQVMIALVGMNLHYFQSSQLISFTSGSDMLSREAVASQRKAMLEFFASSLFSSPVVGRRKAKNALNNIPFPI